MKRILPVVILALESTVLIMSGKLHSAINNYYIGDFNGDF